MNLMEKGGFCEVKCVVDCLFVWGVVIGVILVVL